MPIAATKRRSYLEENAAAVDVELTADDLQRIDAELPQAAGDRYDEAGMASVELQLRRVYTAATGRGI